MKRILIIVSIALTLVLLAFGFTIYYLFNAPKGQDKQARQDKPGIMYHTGDIFLTNLKDFNRILKSDIIIEVEDSETEKKLMQNNYRVRDRIITILSSITENDLKQQNFKDLLKNKIKKDLQNTLNIDKIKDVYFNEFVVQ